MNNREPVRMVIIDDIKSVVDGLTSIEWTSCGVEVAGVSANGLDGLALVSETKPDIVITDIRMPRMDGLTMLKEILALKHACKVILISGYSDFEYAKQAVQLGAFDFVVKPFTEEEIVGAVVKARDQVLEERTKVTGIKEMERRLRESMPLLRQEYFTLLVNHRTPWEQAANRWAFLNVGLEPRGFAVMLLSVDGFEEHAAGQNVHEVELVRFSLQNIVEETVGKHAKSVVFRFGVNRFVAVLNEPTLFQVGEIAERCCQNIARFTKFTVSIGVGGTVEHVHELPDSYRQAERALAYHLFTGGNGAVGYDAVAKTGGQEPVGFDGKEELLLVLRSGNGERASALLADISRSLTMADPQPNPLYSLSLYEELAASAIRTLYELVPYQEAQPLVDRYRAARESAGSTLTGLEQRIHALVRGGADLVRDNSLSEGQAIVYKSLDFLKSQLDSNAGVTVADCAACVHLSASYYSSLFKKVTGMTFTQYVTSERINKAKAMIVGGMPVQDVAAAVGYEERRYFSEMFKKATGMTPSEFRESYFRSSTPSDRQ
ncbi:response regulator transcription factor [Cohnella panacarvi]|uniref:response regulator transcription factor n=1 Tax=Cohnella panacarvi TaxID=400776 RepID=UPI000478C684|nr:response regulator [Cohnella panacarvi]